MEAGRRGAGTSYFTSEVTTICQFRRVSSNSASSLAGGRIEDVERLLDEQFSSVA